MSVYMLVVYTLHLEETPNIFDQSLTIGAIFSYDLSMEIISKRIKNGFSGVRVDGNSRVFVDVGQNPELVALMVDKNPDSINDSWDKFCDLLPDEMDPRGEVNIEYMYVDGEARVFH